MKALDRRVPEEGISLIQKWEGYSETWYKDSGGVASIGYGFTKWTPGIEIANIPEPLPRRIGNRMLREVVREHYGPGVLESIRDGVILGSHQLGALVSFAYNVGLSAWKDSTLREHVNAGATARARREFMEWIYVDGSIVPGLMNRRKAEARMFESDVRGAHRIEAEEIPTYPPTTFAGAKAYNQREAQRDEVDDPFANGAGEPLEQLRSA